MTDSTTGIIDLSAEVVASFIANNKVEISEIPSLIASVHAALSAAATGKAEELAPTLSPAVSIKKSVTRDFIICLEDGKRFKSLKRHLRTSYGMSADEYRAKWGLSSDYPMVAPAYAEARSTLAKQMGLGQQRSKQVASEPAPKAKGRPRKAASSRSAE
jgi:predicted transcriptional regulator